MARETRLCDDCPVAKDDLWGHLCCGRRSDHRCRSAFRPRRCCRRRRGLKHRCRVQGRNYQHEARGGAVAAAAGPVRDRGPVARLSADRRAKGEGSSRWCRAPRRQRNSRAAWRSAPGLRGSKSRSSMAAAMCSTSLPAANERVTDHACGFFAAASRAFLSRSRLMCGSMRSASGRFHRETRQSLPDAP